MTVLLDTTVLIALLRGNPERRAQLAEMVLQGDLLATAAINIAEIYAGMRQKEAERTEALLSKLECYAMTGAIARRAGSLKWEFARRGQTLTLAGMVVAATALEHGAVLLTDNRNDFPIAELRTL